MKATPTSIPRYTLTVEAPAGPAHPDFFQVELAVRGRRRGKLLRLAMASASLAALIVIL